METIELQLSRTCKIAAAFDYFYQTIDPRSRDQGITICIVRPLDKGPRQTFVGVTVKNPNDPYVTNSQNGAVTGRDLAHRIALGRALEQMLGIAERGAYDLARKALWNYQMDQAAKAQLAKVNAEIVDDIEK